MRLSNGRISIKLVRPYELGWTDTHATQVHVPQDYIKNWKEKVTLNGFLVIQGWGIERISAYSLPTDGTWNKKPPRSPRIRKTPFPDKKGKYPSAWSRIKVAGDLIKKRFKEDKILLITCENTNDENNFILILCRLDDLVLRTIKNQTDIKLTKNISKVFKKNDKSYSVLKNLAERMCELIQINLDTDFDDKYFDIKSLEDARKKVKRLITLRQGQSKFRAGLMKDYNSKCCITECEVLDVLEACHIFPYMGPKTNHLTNGLLLRSDLHLLYDKRLLCIDQNFKVKISGRLKDDPMYKIYHGKQINLPYEDKPDKKALELKLIEFIN